MMVLQIHLLSAWMLWLTIVAMLHISITEKEEEARTKLEALKIQMQLIAEYGSRIHDVQVRGSGSFMELETKKSGIWMLLRISLTDQGWSQSSRWFRSTTSLSCSAARYHGMVSSQAENYCRRWHSTWVPYSPSRLHGWLLGWSPCQL